MYEYALPLTTKQSFEFLCQRITSMIFAKPDPISGIQNFSVCMCVVERERERERERETDRAGRKIL